MSMGSMGGTPGLSNLDQLAKKTGQTAGMTPAAGNKMLPGAQPGKPPANQLQQAMAPTTAGGPQAPGAPPPLMGTMRPGQGPVAPQPLPQQNIAFENRAQNQGFNTKPTMGPVAPMNTGTGLRQDTTAQQAQMQQRNIMRQARGGGY